MNDFEPGEGWREINEREWLQTPIDSDCVDSIIDGRHRRWVREVPVLALPTEPYTVIRVTWRSDSARPALGDLGIRTLFPDGTWTGWAVENLLERITGFEVLAAPTPRVALYQEQQRVVRLVLARLKGTWTRDVGYRFDEVAREFGVFGVEA